MSQFKEKFEVFEEKLADGELFPDTLARVISLVEEAKQKANKPESSRQRHSVYSIEAQIFFDDASHD